MIYRGQLLLATIVIAAGMVLLAIFPQWMNRKELAPFVAQPHGWWSVLWLLLGVQIGWRCVRAVISPYAEYVQEAVGRCLMSIIMLDAVVCFAVRDLYPWTVVILALLLPLTFLRKWSYST